MSIRTVPIDSLRLHPDAEKVPMPSRADLDRLRASLTENGQQDPLDVTADGVVLDGRTRWLLLQEIGALEVDVRTQDIPEAQQTRWIIERALDRRHLTMAQKQSLNSMLRSLVIETIVNVQTGEEMRIGMNRPQRAAKLGVTPQTVKNWDEAEGSSKKLPDHPDAPTHIRRGGGNIGVLPVRPKTRTARPPRPEPLRKGRPIPAWGRQFTKWCKNSSRPEDRDFLRRLDRDLHAALEQNGITCEKEGIA